MLYTENVGLWDCSAFLQIGSRISYTIHWLDDEFDYKTRYLDTFYLPSDLTATNIASALKNIRQTWKLPKEGQMSVTTDNGANMISAANILKCQRLSCFGHDLNLAVTNL